MGSTLECCSGRGLLTNLQSNTNDHTGASKRERSFTQENKYDFQAGPLKPCTSWVMKTIDYLIYLVQKKIKNLSQKADELRMAAAHILGLDAKDSAEGI